MGTFGFNFSIGFPAQGFRVSRCVPEEKEVLAPYLEKKAPEALATRLRESRPPEALTEVRLL